MSSDCSSQQKESVRSHVKTLVLISRYEEDGTEVWCMVRQYKDTLTRGALMESHGMPHDQLIGSNCKLSRSVWKAMSVQTTGSPNMSWRLHCHLASGAGFQSSSVQGLAGSNANAQPQLRNCKTNGLP